MCNMTRIADRIYYSNSNDLLLFRIKSTMASVIISTICAVFLFWIINTMWIFAFAGIHGLLVLFGYSDYVFDKKNRVFAKRYGIGNYILGDSYRFQFDGLEIKSKLTHDDGVFDLYLIQIISSKQKIEFYTSKNLTLIQSLYKIIETSGIEKLTWEINEKE